MMIRTNVVLMKFELMYSFGAILCVFSDFARPGFSFKLRHCMHLTVRGGSRQVYIQLVNSLAQRPEQRDGFIVVVVVAAASLRCRSRRVHRIVAGEAAPLLRLRRARHRPRPMYVHLFSLLPFGALFVYRLGMMDLPRANGLI
jgi:hypothetical protein